MLSGIMMSRKTGRIKNEIGTVAPSQGCRVGIADDPVHSIVEVFGVFHDHEAMCFLLF